MLLSSANGIALSSIQVEYLLKTKNSINFKTLPKAQRTRGFSALTKETSIGLITSSDINLHEKIQLWNLDKGSTSKPQPNISLQILTKLQHTQ